jgi:hypothetical protein
VLINGARQTGKTTLVCALIPDIHKTSYITLDDSAVLAGMVRIVPDHDSANGTPEITLEQHLQRLKSINRADFDHPFAVFSDDHSNE